MMNVLCNQYKNNNNNISNYKFIQHTVFFGKYNKIYNK